MDATRTSPSSPHPTWLPAKASFTHSTLRTSSTSTSQMVLTPLSSPASNNRAQIRHLDRSTRTIRATKRSKGRNIHSVLKAPSHLNPPRGILALSPPAPVFLDRLLVSRLGVKQLRKTYSWGRPTDSHRSDGEQSSNLRLGTS
ncbi:hypothetical protein IEO21_02877 [Rhodonia placenta]|uniref:Uncharacterized protein n=1 Tax=Rhodonia placenta TaxID=104341 RepID=A0A8H7P781_9APHY|nr:hypothetical protein IEO21_02877 [Postia placenta]